MIGYGNTLRVASPPVIQNAIVPAPIMGMNAAMNITEEDPRVCIWCSNIIPEEYGLRVRKGFREWQISIGADEAVRTLIVYYGRSGVSIDKIFACTTTGIWDVTTGGATGSQVLVFGTQNSVSGHGVWINYVTEASADLIFYADEANGLFTYTASTNTWAATAGITTAPGSANTFSAGTIAFIVQHKLRLWLIPRNANYAWYLPVRAIAGDAEEFFFGSKFRHGGELVGLYNWTVDGGQGRDDNLVAISRGGDVIPYTGEDPSDSLTWTSTGVFHIGSLPAYGREMAAEHGGELFMLSSHGVSTLSDLLKGGNPLDPFRNKIGYRIARQLRQDMVDYRADRPWQITLSADQGLLLVNTPRRSDNSYRQYTYTLATMGWGMWKAVPMYCSATYNGSLMVGTTDARVLRMDRNADAIPFAETTKTPIQWEVLSSYSTLGSPGLFKRVKLIRPNFVAERRPSYEVTAYYDYRFDAPPAASDISDIDIADVWDTGLWGTAVWGTANAVPYHKALGAAGVGRAVAIAMAGASLDDTFLASWDLAWDVGGFL